MNSRRLIGWLAHAGRRRFFINVLLLLMVALASGLVAISPLALTYLNSRKSLDWTRLSAIGQTYGAASAILSCLALVGVAISLFLQARESKATREQALRALHGDLMKMAMDDSLYRACWGEFFSSDDDDAQRAHMYVNMIINHWLLMWELRAITEQHLRSIAKVVMSGDIGHKFWSEGRELRMASAGTRRERRFNLILDEEYSRSSTRITSQKCHPRVRRSVIDSHKNTIYGVAGGVAIGAFGSVVARRLKARRRSKA